MWPIEDVPQLGQASCLSGCSFLSCLFATMRKTKAKISEHECKKSKNTAEDVGHGDVAQIASSQAQDDLLVAIYDGNCIEVHGCFSTAGGNKCQVVPWDLGIHPNPNINVPT